jgi:adhesin/invasin
VTASVTATIGGTPATVQFAGLAPGYAGLYQVNVVVPQLAAGDYPLQLSVAGIASNSATVSVR